MPRRKKESNEEIIDKLDFIGLDLDTIPEKFKKIEPLEFRIPRFYDEKKYRQYRYVDINDIQILLSPTNRLESIGDKYKKARPLCEYLDNKKEENIIKHTTFLNMLKNLDINEIKKIEKEQANLNKEIPFKIKFDGNYLWQIYYSANTDKYFMIVPTEDTDCTAFFYLLKKQLENKKTGKIFVPISGVNYSNTILKKNEFEDIENYLWLFTKDWPSIYEVYNKKNELSIQIIGETNVYEKIKTMYKVVLDSSEKANEFYKLAKALFILQTELPEFYNFETNIDKNGSLEFYLDGKKVEYKNMVEFIREQYKIGLKRRKELKSQIRLYTKKLKKLKEIVAGQEIEYLAKEKQISTFLECKKSFFGKFKYYFKYSKKSNRKLTKNDEEQEIDIDVEVKPKVEKTTNVEAKKEKKRIPIKKVYTLEELITRYKELQELETTMKNLLMDVNALKLKNKNMTKKIENASKFIEEIDNHKKSIFEFWKYSNKDEVAVLPEGEQEEVNVIKKIEKAFNYEDDFEEFGKKLDQIQRKNLNRDDTDSIFIATTDLIDVLNKVKNDNASQEDIEDSLKKLKTEAKELKSLNEEEYDIFGNIIEDKTKIKKINNKKHRELPKDKFNILLINRNTRSINYKVNLQLMISNISNALEKGIIPEKMPVYKAITGKEIDNNEINVFNVNPENEMKEAVLNDGSEINLYKLNIKEGTKGIGFTNIIFYDNQNKTLPVGMDLSTKLIVNTSNLHYNLLNKKSFNIISFEDESDDFSDIVIKNVNIFEYDIVELEDLK